MGDGRDAGSLQRERDRRSVDDTRRAYQRIPYASSPWTSAQPARLETIARLYGVGAAPADRCRLLEIGCGDGGHVIPLAVAHPDSQFVGVDLAPVHIERAREAADALGLENLELVAASFDEIGQDRPPFDYVVAHGLLSWVSPTLQDRLLETCGRLLGPHGVAFVSYNTHPGWAMQHAVRDAMRAYNRGVSDVEHAVDRARDLLELLVETVPGRESAYREHLESIAAVARDPARRHYFAHEYLEDENHPFYVRDFIERAAAKGLTYLADADLVDAELDNMPEAPRSRILERVGDPVGRLQLLDFVMNRKFRQSLLCKAEASPRPDVDLPRIEEMYVVSALKTDDDPAAIRTDAVMRFADRHGRTIELDQPVAKAALMRFVEVSSQPIAVAELVEWARTRVGAPPVRDAADSSEERLLVALIFGRLFTAGMAEVRASPPCWATEAGPRPVASPLARLAARHGGGRTASLRHTSVALDNDDVCAVIRLLDGEHDRAAIARALDGRVDADAIETILDLAARNALLLPVRRRRV